MFERVEWIDRPRRRHGRILPARDEVARRSWIRSVHREWTALGLHDLIAPLRHAVCALLCAVHWHRPGLAAIDAIIFEHEVVEGELRLLRMSRVTRAESACSLSRGLRASRMSLGSWWRGSRLVDW